jgi:hypothetical protein
MERAGKPALFCYSALRMFEARSVFGDEKRSRMIDISSIPLTYTVTNFVLAMIMYTLMARFILGIFFDASSGMVIWKVFQQVTDPVLRAVRLVTPAVVPFGLVLIFAILWVIALRLLLLLTFIANGWINLGGAS